MFRKTSAAILGLALAASAASAESHVDPGIAAAIKARQSHMSLYAFNIGVLGGMAQENIPYDAAMASAAAANLAALSKLDQSRYWPEGSDMDSVEGTDALPKIWEDMAGVGEKIDGLVQAAAAMESAAGTDLASLKAAMGDLGGACGACHKAYRKPDE